MGVVETLAVALGASWASGINLYAAVATLGLFGRLGVIDLPAGWQVLENPLVIGAGALMYVVEFVLDKVPGVDSLWDGLHTFIRIPAGAVLAYAAVGDVDPSLALAAGLVGGGIATVNHATKAGLRLAINTSPEPVTNSLASVTEDATAVGGLWLAALHPELFVAALILWLLLLAWLLPKLWRFLRHGLGRLATYTGRR